MNISFDHYNTDYYNAKYLGGEEGNTQKTMNLFFNEDSKHLPDKNSSCATAMFKKQTNKNKKLQTSLLSIP